jgi:RNA polymerase sigma-70 factor (ECF subfamily)
MAAVSPLGRASGVEPRDAPADALTGLYERHASRVFQYCLNWLRSREEAEDAAQTTFLYAYRGLDRGVVPAHERGWLLSIARNVCLSRTDAARRRSVEVAQDPHALEETVAAPAPPAELEGLKDALATLTEQQRHAILLREWHGLTYSEIADRLDLSQAAVETLLFRARRSLARRLRQPLGTGSFLPWLRSLTGGGAAKIALGAAAVAVTASTGAIAIAHRHQHQPGPTTPARATHHATAGRPPAALRRPAVARTKQHSAPSRAAAPAGSSSYTTAQQPAGPQVDGARPSATTAAAPPVLGPIATVHTVTSSVTTTATTTTATTTTATTTTTAAAAVGGVVDTATAAVAGVTNTVTNTASTAVATVTGTAAATAATTVTAAQSAIAAVTSAVPAVTIPSLP